MAKKKLGRNDPCHCGSGKKYKKCCLRSDQPGPPPKMTAEDLMRIRDKIREHQQKEAKRQEEYGDVRPIIHADLAGKKIVAIGNEIAYSDKWKTFIDFLLDYPKLVLGKEWGQAEMSKPLEERHQILRWYDDLCDYSKMVRADESGALAGIPSGPMAAYLNFAYDLYALRHHMSLQEEVVRRIKHADQFQGARYELFVAATCIRTGFDVEFEDETDTTRRHPEFIAIHRATGQKIAVEAKSKHRYGVLGFAGGFPSENQNKARVRNLLEDAFAKDVQIPFAIFLDVNLPPEEGRVLDKPWVREVIETIDIAGGKTEDGRDKFNLLMVTNHPQHYGDPLEPVPVKDSVAVLSQTPLFPMAHPDVLVDLHRAAEQYGNIPVEFPEDDNSF
jgi:hypothetical protein